VWFTCPGGGNGFAPEATGKAGQAVGRIIKRLEHPRTRRLALTLLPRRAPIFKKTEQARPRITEFKFMVVSAESPGERAPSEAVSGEI
jgi:hypothetical protein